MIYIWKECTYIMAELIIISFVLIYGLVNTLYFPFLLSYLDTMAIQLWPLGITMLSRSL